MNTTKKRRLIAKRVAECKDFGIKISLYSVVKYLRSDLKVWEGPDHVFALANVLICPDSSRRHYRLTRLGMVAAGYIR